MKLTKITKRALTFGLASTLMLIAGSTLTINAGNIPSGKGGATLLVKQGVPATAMVAPLITCTRCTDKFTAVRDLSARGANKQVTLVAQHQCGGCSTRIETVGTGKAKQNVALHTCASSNAQNLTCCTRNQ